VTSHRFHAADEGSVAFHDPSHAIAVAIRVDGADTADLLIVTPA